MAKAATMMRDEQGLGGKLRQFPARTKSFFSEVRNEMRKVTFPGRKEVQGTTVVVIITVALFGLFFFLTDQVFIQLLDRWVFHHVR